MPQASLSREQLTIELEINDPDLWPEDVSAWDEAIWDGVPEPAEPGYLTPTVGTVSTPDPGPLPPDCTFIITVLGPDPDLGAGTYVVSQDDPGSRSWIMERQMAGWLAMLLFYDASGANYAYQGVPTPVATPVLDDPEQYAVALGHRPTDFSLAMWRPDPAGEWVRSADPQTFPIGGPLFTGTGPVRIGAHYGDTPAGRFAGRIYSIELRTGLDPRDTGRSLAMHLGSVSTPDTPDMTITGPMRLSFRARIDQMSDQFPSIVFKQTPEGVREMMVYGYMPQNNVTAFSTASTATAYDGVAIAQPTPLGEVHTYGVEFEPGVQAATTFVDDVRWVTAFGGECAIPHTAADLILSYGFGAGFGTGQLYWAQLEQLDFGGNPTRLIWRFDADEAPTDATRTTWTDPRGRTWTINNPLAISGRTVWKFDANEYIGAGMSYVDPRGRTWTLSAPGAITPRVPAKGDAIWSDEAGWVDVTCDSRGFIIERGRQMVWDDLQSASIQLELDNRRGRYSVYGSLSWPRIRPGLGCRVHATWDGITYPLFVGHVSEYTEGQTPGDYKVAIKAQDAFRMLADPISVEYNPGVPAERCGTRINRLLDSIHYEGKRSIAAGESTMTNYLSTRTLLDEIKITAESDGGVVFVDTDGTLMYMGKERIFGRARGEQTSLPSFSDDCSGANLPYAAIEPILADNEFGNIITVANVSQGNDSPRAAIRVDTDSVNLNGRYLWSPRQLVICNAEWVDSLADFHLARRSTAFYRVNSFECYPIHDDRLWPALLGLRIGDSLVVQRTPPESNTLIAPMICDGLRVESTPEMMKWTVRCSPGDKVEIANFWDFANWDEDVWV